MVDKDSKWIGGAALAISGDGRKIISGVNTARNVVSYEQAPAASAWVWSNQGGNAK